MGSAERSSCSPHSGDNMLVEKRSAIISRIKGKNITPERIIFSGLHRAGVYFAKMFLIYRVVQILFFATLDLECSSTAISFVEAQTQRKVASTKLRLHENGTNGIFGSCERTAERCCGFGSIKSQISQSDVLSGFCLNEKTP